MTLDQLAQDPALVRSLDLKNLLWPRYARYVPPLTAHEKAERLAKMV
jgi:hypothetical protein